MSRKPKHDLVNYDSAKRGLTRRKTRMDECSSDDMSGLYRAIVDEGYTLFELLHAEELKYRKLYLTEEISQYSVLDTVKAILKYNLEDKHLPAEKRRPIVLYISTNGGEVDAGFELIDVIQTSKTPVYTVNLGYLYSMGALIGIVGHKRFAMPSATYLIHDGTSFVYNSGSKAQDQMRFNIAVENRIKEHILKYSKITEEEYDSKVRHEWYMFSDEALEKGLVDKIVGAEELDELL